MRHLALARRAAGWKRAPRQREAVPGGGRRPRSWAHEDGCRSSGAKGIYQQQTGGKPFTKEPHERASIGRPEAGISNFATGLIILDEQSCKMIQTVIETWDGIFLKNPLGYGTKPVVFP